jgi:phosphate transport system permease protein
MTASPTSLPSGNLPSPTGKTLPRLLTWVNLGDRVVRRVCQIAASLVILLALLLVLMLVWEAWPSIRTNGLGFFTEKTWDPEESHRIFGALAFVYGTLVSSALAMLLAVPLGIGTAAFLSEVAPHWLRRSGSFLVEMLAAIPSVVYGFWGLFVLGPSLQRMVSSLGGPNFGGVGIFPAGIILAIMIVPYVSAVSFDVCRAVPAAQREASLALGATQWQTISSVVLPYARPGIIAASFIALGRALGETMAVTMLIGNSPVIDYSLFAKGDTIASVIANQFQEATYDLYRSALVELGLVLFAVTIVVNALARVLLWRVGRGGAGKRKERAPSVPGRLLGSSLTAVTRFASPQWVNRLMIGALGLCLVFTLVPLFLILGYLVYRGIGSVNWDFFVQLPAAVGELHGGMANALVGSAMLVGVATLMAVPVGTLAAIYLAEYRENWLGRSVRFIAELLGGVPSIVIGIFAYALIVQTTSRWFGQPSLFGWAGAFALAIMMVPIVMRGSEEALKLVPQTMRHASLALGAGHWQTLCRVTVPAALPTIITAIFLGIARIVGETAPLLLTAGSNRYWPTSLSDYTPSLPVYIFEYAKSPSDDWLRQAWAAALVLLTLVMLLNCGMRLLTRRR